MPQNIETKEKDIKAPKKEKDEIEALIQQVAEMESELLAIEPLISEAKARIAKKARKVLLKLQEMMFKYDIRGVFFRPNGPGSYGVYIGRGTSNGAIVELDYDGKREVADNVWILEHAKELERAVIEAIKDKYEKKLKKYIEKREEIRKLLRLADMKI